MSKRFGPDVRLRSRREFVAVQRTGRRVTTRLLTVLVLPNSCGRDRLGIVASRKLGGAVVRNRTKRRLRELFRQREPMLAVSPTRRGLDLVVIPKREVAAAAFPALRADFNGALGRAGAGTRP